MFYIWLTYSGVGQGWMRKDNNFHAWIGEEEEDLRYDGVRISLSNPGGRYYADECGNMCMFLHANKYSHILVIN